MDNSPIEIALLAALDLTDDAMEALRGLDLEDYQQKRLAGDLAARIDSLTIFRDHDIEAFDRLLRPLRARIEDGWITEGFVDPYGSGQSWTESRLLPEAEALHAAIAPIEALLKALRGVRNQGNAMRLAGRFYDAANG